MARLEGHDSQVDAVWSIDDDDDDVDLVDEDELLDEEDRAKPDPASLRGKKPTFLTTTNDFPFSSRLLVFLTI